MSITDTLNRFISLLKDEKHFEAHEVLELHWHKLKKENHPQSNLAKGLINAAIAFEHIKRNTPTAMQKAVKTYSGYKRYSYLKNDASKEWIETCDTVESIAFSLGLKKVI